MRRLLFIVTIVGAVATVSTPIEAQAALLPQQVEAVIALLSAFGADKTVIANVRATLGGGTTTAAPTAAGSLGFAPGVQPPRLTLSPSTNDVPFTVVYLLNNTTAQVEIYTVTVERYGTASDSYLRSAQLRDASGTTRDTVSSFDTRHQATLAGNGLTLAAGGSAVVTIVGDLTNKRATSNKTIGLKVVAINASAPLLGTLPVSGTTHTID